MCSPGVVVSHTEESVMHMSSCKVTRLVFCGLRLKSLSSLEEVVSGAYSSRICAKYLDKLTST